MTLKIAILDSGMSNHFAIDNINVTEGWHYFIQNENVISKDADINDQYGHGTAVTFIISDGCKKKNIEVEFFIIRIFEKEETEEELLIHALIDLLNKQIDIIHISAGISYYTGSELEDVCKRHYENNTIIVSAYDNAGSISYPAAFPYVVGVDANAICKKTSEFIYVSNSIINILAFGSQQRLPWVNNSFQYVAGSSFAAPYITILAAEYRTLFPQNGLDKFLLYLKEHTKKILNFEQPSLNVITPFSPQKALIFPFNKEQHTLIHYYNLINFKIEAVADCKLTGQVGRKVGSDNNIYTIENIEHIDWNMPFDTIILGHTRILKSLTGRDWIKEILSLCLKWEKNIFSYDELSSYENLVLKMKEKGLQVYWPSLCKKNKFDSHMNKLYHLSTPTVMVVGTRSKIGKFSLQICLKKMIEDIGYKVGFLSSEPNGLLFGAKKILPFGYDSFVELNEKEFIQASNNFLHEIEVEEKPDLLLMGSQSNNIPLSMGNLGFYPLFQHAFILSSDPDAFILCFGPDDDIDYLIRNIKYLDSVAYGKTISLVFFPFKNMHPLSTLSTHLVQLNEQEINRIIGEIREKTSLPVYCPISNKKDLKLLCNRIINFF